jgi:ankyrin repeat protein
MIARMTMNTKLAGGGAFGNNDPALQRSPEAIIKDRVDHCKDVQFVQGKQLFGVLYTTIHKAAMDGSCAGISYFINPGPGRGTLKKAFVDDYDKNSVCPIHYAAERGHDHVVQQLIENECDVDIESGDKMTALMYAAKEGKCSTIQLLWDNKAKLLKGNRAGMTAAHFAAQGNHYKALELLVKLSDRDRQEAIEVAKANDLKRLANSTSADDASQSMPPSVKSSVYKKSLPPTQDPALMAMLGYKVPNADDADDVDDEFSDEEDDDDMSVGSRSSKKKRKQKERPKTLEEVLAVPASIVVDTASSNGLRPLHMSAMCNSLDCVRFLISAGVNVEAQDKVGETALHKAARKSYFAIYSVLVKDGGANEIILNLSRQTPAQILKDDTAM